MSLSLTADSSGLSTAAAALDGLAETVLPEPPDAPLSIHASAVSAATVADAISALRGAYARRVSSTAQSSARAANAYSSGDEYAAVDIADAELP